MPLGLFKGVINLVQRLTTAVPNFFGTRDQFLGRQFFHGLGGGTGNGFGLIQAHYTYRGLYFYLAAISGYSTLILGLGFTLL